MGFSSAIVRHMPRMNQATQVLGFLSDGEKKLDMVVISFAASGLYWPGCFHEKIEFLPTVY